MKDFNKHQTRSLLVLAFLGFLTNVSMILKILFTYFSKNFKMMILYVYMWRWSAKMTNKTSSYTSKCVCAKRWVPQAHFMSVVVCLYFSRQFTWWRDLNFLQPSLCLFTLIILLDENYHFLWKRPVSHNYIWGLVYTLIFLKLGWWLTKVYSHYLGKIFHL